LLTTLVSSAEGIRYLGLEDQFLPQIVKSFDQLDPVSHSFPTFFLSSKELRLQFNGVPESDPIFSKRRVADTLTYGYLEMLGVLSKHKDGIECV